MITASTQGPPPFQGGTTRDSSPADSGSSRPSRRGLSRTYTAASFNDVFDSEVVPSSLSSIASILRVANEIERERPRVAYLCEYIFAPGLYTVQSESIMNDLLSLLEVVYDAYFYSEILFLEGKSGYLSSLCLDQMILLILLKSVLSLWRVPISLLINL
jgi:hypothetical protein